MFAFDATPEAIRHVLAADPAQQGHMPALALSGGQYELGPVLVNLPNARPATSSTTTTIAVTHQPSERQRQISGWIEQVAQFLETGALESFVRQEVAQSRIGIDFKKILLEQKTGRQRQTRRVVR